MVKHKKFQMLWILGAFFCMIPLIGYSVYFHFIEKDQVVELRLISPGTAAIAAPAAQSAGPARVKVELAPGTGTAPPGMSSDGTHWWDGTQWHRL